MTAPHAAQGRGPAALEPDSVPRLAKAAESLVGAVARLQDGSATLLTETKPALSGVAQSVSETEGALASLVRHAGAVAPITPAATERTDALKQHAEGWSDTARAALGCARACDEAAASAEFQLHRRATLRAELVRVPHLLRLLRQAREELRRQNLGATAPVYTLQGGLDYSARVLLALETGEQVLAQLCARCGELAAPERQRRLLACAGRNVCRGTAYVREQPIGGMAVSIGEDGAGVLMVQWSDSRPELARLYPIAGLRWGAAGRALKTCFDLEEPVRARGILSLIHPAFALWDRRARRGRLVRRGMLRWNGTRP